MQKTTYSPVLISFLYSPVLLSPTLRKVTNKERIIGVSLLHVSVKSN